MTLTYARFLAVVLGPPLLWVGIKYGRVFLRRGYLPLLMLLGIVYAATTPWDNLAVARGYWSFDPSKTWPMRWWYLPVEEYLFFGLQTLLVGTWATARLRQRLSQRLRLRSAPPSTRTEPEHGGQR